MRMRQLEIIQKLKCVFLEGCQFRRLVGIKADVSYAQVFVTDLHHFEGDIQLSFVGQQQFTILMSLTSVIKCLENTISSDRIVLLEAQLELERSANQDLNQFISNMSNVLAGGKNSAVARQAAGLQLKNCLTSRNVSLKKEYQKRWLSLPLKTRIGVREQLLSSLGTENIHPSCSAHCLACICAAELFSHDEEHLSFGNHCLSEVLTALKNIISATAANERRKEAAMEAINFVCQELSPKVLVHHSLDILGPVLTCIEKQRPGKKIRLKAANALLNSLEFAIWHFLREGDRNLIMQVVCDATQSPTVEEVVISLQILAKIASCYYDHLFNYMAQAVIPITYKAIASDDTNVSLQGMEFWCSIAEIELNLASGVYDPACALPVSRRYAEKALPKLVPLLVTVLANWPGEPNDIDDLDDWTPVKGAVACLVLLSQCCSDKIDFYILPVQSCLENSDWRQRIAALWAFSSMLEEIDSVKAHEKLEPLMPLFWELTQDPESAKIRLTALTLTNRIFQTCPALIPESHLGLLVKGLINHLKDEPQIASLACANLSSLVKAVYNQTVKETKEQNQMDTFPLSRYFEKIVNRLLKLTGKRTTNSLLLTAAHQALEIVLTNFPEDCCYIVKNTFRTLLHQLKQMVNGNTTWENDQTLVLLTLSSGLVRLNANDLDTIQFRREFMSCLMKLLLSGINHEDLIEAITITIPSLGPELNTNLASMTSYLKSALKSPDVCPMLVGLIGDLIHVLGEESIPYLDDFCKAIFDLLAKNDRDYKLRTECITALNEMALSVGLKHFRPYLAATLKVLKNTSRICTKNASDEEEMQDTILKSYTTIFSFMKHEEYVTHQPQHWTNGEDFLQSLLQECLANLSNFIAAFVDDETSDAILTTSGALVGVIITEMGAVESLKYLEPNLNVNWLLNAAANCASDEFQQVCKNALFELQVSGQC